MFERSFFIWAAASRRESSRWDLFVRSDPGLPLKTSQDYRVVNQLFTQQGLHRAEGQRSAGRKLQRRQSPVTSLSHLQTTLLSFNTLILQNGPHVTPRSVRHRMIFEFHRRPDNAFLNLVWELSGIATVVTSVCSGFSEHFVKTPILRKKKKKNLCSLSTSELFVSRLV